jgi:hypothetical protein
MAGFTNYAEGKILDHILGTASYTFVSNMYLGLFSAAPTDAGGGTELNYSGYSRVNIQSKFGTATGTPRTKTNNVPIVGSNVNTSGAQTATHVGIFDANSGGNLICWAALNSSQVINVGCKFSFATGTITIGCD